MRLQHISIPRAPEREDETRAFYGDLLGMKELPVPTTIAHLNLIWFQISGDTELHVFLSEEENIPAGRHFCLIVDDVQIVREKIEHVGYEVWDLNEINPEDYSFFHIHQIIKATMNDSEGYGTLENLVVGRHDPSGFKDLFDVTQ